MCNRCSVGQTFWDVVFGISNLLLAVLFGAALGNDVFGFQECFARASLVDRLARNRFAQDPKIHAEARRGSSSATRYIIWL